MSLLRLAALPLIALALVAPAQAAANPLKKPTDVHAFLADKRTGEPTFSRTPSFTWKAVRGATKYEFALSTSLLFAGSGLIWDDATLTTPVAAVPIALPWITGNPHSLYARVRAIGANGAASHWSDPYGFDMRWIDDGVPKQLQAANGLVSWTPIDGATGYQVWFLNINTMGSGKNKIISTTTNAADEREYYTFHNGGSFTSTVRWRVRAVRRVDFAPTNKLPTVSYGPWSDTYTSWNSPFQTGLFANLSTRPKTDVSGDEATHRLTPAFHWSGDTGSEATAELWRVYAFSDSDCVNPVFTGSIVGSPAYVPRSSGPLKLPASDGDLVVAREYALADGDQKSYSSAGEEVTPTEGMTPSAFTAVYLNQPTAGGSGGSSPSGGSSSSGASSSGSTSSGTPTASSSSTGIVFPSTIQSVGSPIDLWDINWPTGQYYWTVVPVYFGASSYPPPGLAPPIPAPSLDFAYWDGDVPADACASGRRTVFGKASAQPATTSPNSKTPYVWGLSPGGALLAATRPTPKVYGPPLVAWEPALAASAYEVQWSKTEYPWRPEGNLFTFSTSTTLQLKPGRWFYRVRGIDFSLPTAASQMAWSDPLGIVVAKPKFQLVKGK